MCDFINKCIISNVKYGWLNYKVIKDDWMYGYNRIDVILEYDNINYNDMETLEW